MKEKIIRIIKVIINVIQKIINITKKDKKDI